MMLDQWLNQHVKHVAHNMYFEGDEQQDRPCGKSILEVMHTQFKTVILIDCVAYPVFNSVL